MCGWRPVTNRPWPPHEPQNGPGRLLPAWGGAGGSGRGGPAPPAGGGPRTWGVESPARTPLLTGIVDRCWGRGATRPILAEAGSGMQGRAGERGGDGRAGARPAPLSRPGQQGRGSQGGRSRVAGVGLGGRVAGGFAGTTRLASPLKSAPRISTTERLARPGWGDRTTRPPVLTARARVPAAAAVPGAWASLVLAEGGALPPLVALKPRAASPAVTRAARPWRAVAFLTVTETAAGATGAAGRGGAVVADGRGAGRVGRARSLATVAWAWGCRASR